MSAVLSSFAATSAPLYHLHAGPGGVFEFSPNCEEGHKLGLALLEKMWAMDRARDDRGAESQPRPVIVIPAPAPTVDGAQTVAAGSTAVSASEKPTPDTSTTSTMRMSELLALHMGNLRQGTKHASDCSRDRAYAMHFVIDLLGDCALAAVTPHDAIAVADALAVWPRRKQNLRHLDGLSVSAVAQRAKREKLPAISAGTQFKHLTHINAFMNWAVVAGEVPENPFRHIKLSRYKRDERGKILKKKDTFSVADLRKIFDPVHLAAHDAPHKFWAPLIAHRTGMRVNEIAQLHLDDVCHKPYLDEDGVEREVLVFNIGAHRDGQSVKTNYSIRDIPVPEVLRNLGFERYLEDVRESGSEWLFPGLIWEEGGPGRTVSQWFNDSHLRKACQIKSPRKTLHCFRHNLTTLMERAGIPESIRQSVNGHSPGTGLDQRHYVADGTVLECQQVLDRLPFPDLPLVHYVPGRFERYLRHAAAEREREVSALAGGELFKRRRGRFPASGPAGSAE
jgi:integrase